MKLATRSNMETPYPRFAEFQLALLRREQTDGRRRPSNTAMLVHTDAKGIAWALQPPERLQASSFKNHFGWQVEQNDLDAFLRKRDAGVAFALGQLVRIHSSSADNAK